MVGFSAHFALGLIFSIPWVIKDKKSRFRTLIVGGFAAVIPDLDSPGVYFDFIEHRGWVHSCELLFIGISFAFIGAMLLAALDIRRNPQEPKREVIKDKLYYLGAFSVGWATHLIADFGLTKYKGQEGLIYSLTREQLYVLDNIAGLVVAAVLCAIIWYQTLEEHERFTIDDIRRKIVRILKRIKRIFKRGPQ